MKKLESIILTLLLVALIPAAAFAADDEVVLTFAVDAGDRQVGLDDRHWDFSGVVRGIKIMVGQRPPCGLIARAMVNRECQHSVLALLFQKPVREFEIEVEGLALLHLDKH